MKPMRFEISETDEVLVAHSGLAIAGAALGHTQLKKQLNQIRVPGKPRPEISHYDCILAMTALLCLAKTDFDDIETYRQNDFFSRSLGLQAVASAETLRQRLNDLAPIEDCASIVRRWKRLCHQGLRIEGMQSKKLHPFFYLCLLTFKLVVIYITYKIPFPL